MSAWTDGEVPSPWKERISDHLASCADCADRVAGFRRLSTRLLASGRLDDAVIVARIASRLGIKEGKEAAGSAGLGVVSSPARRTGIALPLPAAAAAAAALLILGGLSGRMIGAPGMLARSPSSTQATEVASTSSSGNPTMDSLVRYIEAQNAPGTISIVLPANASFSGGGAPMIVKTPPVETVSLPPSNAGLGFVMSGGGN
ncbi:MAG TPA: zf-HC2 domain-containing protein [Rectinemataceae bacterium]|nr:zf-HC2 domain-containing protein [Rectinemataceae bacterium]